jgi:peptidoglycan/LPS O-acetylase OafA/YrhL
MHATVAERSEPAAAPPAVPDGFRPEIQGLRAVAVLLVVAYHLYPNRISGGYVGVDVFFVLSGYLITSHLYREAATTSRLSLTRFWARRIRRLLPASLLVLVFSTLLTWLWVPSTLWDQTLRQLVASALYVQNWALASDAVDYSAAGNAPTLVQHYWSLSVEEQLYLVWPVLVLAVLVATRGRGEGVLRRRLLAVVAVVAVASFVYSVTATSTDAARAYFVTPTRAWEFGAGALLALAGSHLAWGSGRRAVLGWVGLGAIVGSGLTYTDSTPFPGWVAAVPVLGTVAVIAAGTAGGPLSAARWLALRPMTFVGDISYSVYLWHWPLIVVAPYVTGHDLRTRDKAAILVVTILVSWACTRWVEDPLRTSPLLVRVPRNAYLGAVVGMAVVVGVVGLLRADLDRSVRESRAAAADVVDGALTGAEPCIGPAALDAEHRRRHRCGSVAGRDGLLVEPAAVARQNRQEIAYPGCESDLNRAELLTCDLGTTTDPRGTLAVAGDSHATHWFGALDRLGKDNRWRVRTYTRASCPFTDARRTLPEEPAHRYRLCRKGNAEIERRLLADRSIELVLVSAFSSAYGWEADGEVGSDDPAEEGFRSLWRRLTAAGKQVVVIRDVPAVKDRLSSPDCLVQHPARPRTCSTSRSEGLTPDVQADAVDGAPAGVHVVDLTDQFCDDERCHAAVGGVVVYRDYSHLSQEYSTLLGPYLGRALRRDGLE